MMRNPLGFLSVFLLVSIFGACDCGDDGGSITITNPVNGAVLTVEQDIDPLTPGIQLGLDFETSGIPEGESVAIYFDGVAYLNDQSLTPDLFVPVAAGRGSATVTIDQSLFLLACYGAGCRIRSQIVEVTLGGCESVSFVNPAPSASLTFTESDDKDGSCSPTFNTDVTVATSAAEGSTLQLLVNGALSANTTVSGGMGTFENVVLDRRGRDSNSLEVRVGDAPSICGNIRYPGSIFVDCEGVSCVITQPSGMSAYLGKDADASADPGFQGDFEVTTDGSIAGQTVELIVDGDSANPIVGTVMISGGTGKAEFPGVDLTEGEHTFQAICGDETPTGSAQLRWTVDITECDAVFTNLTPGQIISVAQDIDPALPGIQIDVSLSANCADRANARLANCLALPGVSFEPLAGANYTSQVTLATSGMPTVCGEVTDLAGNVTRIENQVNISGGGPAVSFLSPAANARFNVDGNDYPTGTPHTADLNKATPQCDIEVVVDCEEIGTSVELFELTGNTQIGSEMCVDVAGSGRATFSSVALGVTGAQQLEARQTFGGLTGSSGPLNVFADCLPPSVAIDTPACGGSLDASDDQDPAAPGLQVDMMVSAPDLNSDGGHPDVMLEARSGATVLDSQSLPGSAASPGGTFTFADFSFGAGGSVDVEGCATDDFGNTGCSAACAYTINISQLAISSPANLSVYNAQDAAAADCNGAMAGLDLAVIGTTDAVDGTQVDVQIAGSSVGMAAVSGGAFNICVPVPEGSGIVIRVIVGTGATAVVAQTTITVDTVAPPTGIMLTTASLSRSEVEFSFTAVADSDASSLESYEMRCAQTEFTDEIGWAAATPVAVPITPAGPGAAEVFMRSGYRPVLVEYCALRGADAAGNLTPFVGSVSTGSEFDQQQVMAPGTAESFGYKVEGLGDINGDGFGDFAVGGVKSNVYIYFGQAGSVPTTPSVTITLPIDPQDVQLEAIGDVDGDGRADFGISDAYDNGFGGRLHVFFGRPMADPWPAAIALDGVTCPANVACIDGPALGFFGERMAHAGDFDGDGADDILVTGSFDVAQEGSAFVIRGGTLVKGSFVTANNLNGFKVAVSGTFRLGWNVAPLGDVTGDSRDDFIVFEASSGGTKMHLVTGRMHSGGLQAISTVTSLGSGALKDADCISVGNVGDFNSDGFMDFACTRGDVTGATLFFGDAANNFSSNASVTMSTLEPINDALGFFHISSSVSSLGVAGDVDGDGVTDFCAAATEHRSSEPGGLVMVYGRAGAVSGIVVEDDALSGLLTVEPTVARRSSALIGDVTGDGRMDIAVGEFNSGVVTPDPGGTFAGRVEILY